MPERTLTTSQRRADRNRRSKRPRLRRMPAAERPLYLLATRRAGRQSSHRLLRQPASRRHLHGRRLRGDAQPYRRSASRPPRRNPLQSVRGCAANWPCLGRAAISTLHPSAARSSASISPTPVWTPSCRCSTLPTPGYCEKSPPGRSSTTPAAAKTPAGGGLSIWSHPTHPLVSHSSSTASWRSTRSSISILDPDAWMPIAGFIGDRPWRAFR